MITYKSLKVLKNNTHVIVRKTKFLIMLNVQGQNLEFGASCINVDSQESVCKFESFVTLTNQDLYTETVC